MRVRCGSATSLCLHQTVGGVERHLQRPPPCHPATQAALFACNAVPLSDGCSVGCRFVALVVTSYLDRTSLAFAALQLCHEPWFTPRVYGIGAGLFTLGYVVCQVPSNLVLSHVGARMWLPVITAAWGVVAACCVFISSETDRPDSAVHVLSRFFVQLSSEAAKHHHPPAADLPVSAPTSHLP